MSARDEGRTSQRGVLLGLVAGITVTIVAWGILVLAAIDFGRDARAGTGESWLLMGGATLGAVACLFLTIIFAAKLQARVKATGPRPAEQAAPSQVRAEPSAPTVPDPTPAPNPEPEPDRLDDEGVPRPEPEPVVYRSRHSNVAGAPDPEHADTEDSPAAAYRGKRAKR